MQPGMQTPPEHLLYPKVLFKKQDYLRTGQSTHRIGIRDFCTADTVHYSLTQHLGLHWNQLEMAFAFLQVCGCAFIFSLWLGNAVSDSGYLSRLY